MNPKKIGFFISTGLLTAMMTIAGTLQATAHPDVLANFANVGMTNLPLIQFMGVLKVLGAIALWTNKGRDWAYKGFYFLLVGAIIAHIHPRDPVTEYIPAIVALGLVVVSAVLEGSLRPATTGPRLLLARRDENGVDSLAS